MSLMSQIFHRVTWPKSIDLQMAVCGMSEAFLGFMHRHSSSTSRTFKIGHIELMDESKTWPDAFEKAPPAMSLADVRIKGLQDVEIKANARSNNEVSVRRTRKIHENYLAGNDHGTAHTTTQLCMLLQGVKGSHSSRISFQRLARGAGLR